MNKYERKPDFIVDLHGCTTAEARVILDELLDAKKYNHVRVISGKGIYRPGGPVLQPFVKKYLTERQIRWNPAKIADGGDGAFEVYLR